MRVVCLLSFMVLGASAHAAGLTLELVGLDSGQPIHQTVYVTGSLLASDGEMVDATGKLAPRTMIFDAVKKTVTVIDANQKSYRVLDEAQLRQMGQRMAQARAQAVSRAAMLPPDRRAAMAAMMERHGLSGDLDLGFTATGEKKKVGGFACEVYHVTNHDRPFQTACLAPWDSGPVKKSELDVVHQLAELLKAAAPEMEQATVAIVDRFPGFPVERTQPPIGPLGARTTTLKSIKRGAIAASHFAIPKGLRLETRTVLPAPSQPGDVPVPPR